MIYLREFLAVEELFPVKWASFTCSYNYTVNECFKVKRYAVGTRSVGDYQARSGRVNR